MRLTCWAVRLIPQGPVWGDALPKPQFWEYPLETQVFGKVSHHLHPEQTPEKEDFFLFEPLQYE